MKRWTPIEVIWRDAHGGDLGWVDPSNLSHTAAKVRTVGMLYRKNRKGVTVVLNRAGTDTAAYIFIPAVCITSIKELS